MGLLDLLGYLIGKRRPEASCRSVVTTSTSALPRGRFRQTDRIKGPGSPLPNKPGVYRFVNKSTREVEYVGQTNNLRKRQQQHAKSGKLNTAKQYVQYAVAKTTATKGDLCRTEVDHIARHRPSGNKYKGGNGRQ